MKKFLALMVASLLIFSCSPQYNHKTFYSRIDDFGMIDFRSYSSKNFLFTTEKYQGDYESIGLIDYALAGQAEFRAVTNAEFAKGRGVGGGLFVFENNKRSYQYNNKNKTQWIVEVSTLQEAIDSIYTKAKAMGADAIINLKIARTSDSHGFPEVETFMSRDIYSITGFAIKRK